MSFSQREARSLIRKAVKRVPEGESIRHLNIMPMMDMMTILLVAFIAQYTASEAVLAAGTVSLPRSELSDEMAEEATTIVITPSSIAVEGQPIAAVGRDGDVGCEAKEGGCTGVKITQLTNFLAAIHQAQLIEHARKGTSEPATGPELLIIADRLTQYRLLIEVMFSAKQKESGFKHFRLIVQKNFPPKA
jgi:biopolymer transport protein ExbD